MGDPDDYYALDKKMAGKPTTNTIYDVVTIQCKKVIDERDLPHLYDYGFKKKYSNQWRCMLTDKNDNEFFTEAIWHLRITNEMETFVEKITNIGTIDEDKEIPIRTIPLVYSYANPQNETIYEFETPVQCEVWEDYGEGRELHCDTRKVIFEELRLE